MKVFASSRERAVFLATLIVLSTVLTAIRPVAAAVGFTYSPSNPVVGQTITFDAQCSLPPCEYAWSWGDGTPNGSGDPAYHAYSSAGSYTVRLCGMDANGNLAGCQNQTVTVAGAWIVGHVRDNSLTAVAGTTVDLRSQDGNTLFRRTTTDSTGFYRIAWNTGTYMLNATKLDYWEERINVYVCCVGSTVTKDFRLPQDLFVPVTNLLVMYATVNTQQTQADLSWSLSAGSKTRVDAYVNPLGGRFDVSVEVTHFGSASTATNPALRSLIYQRGVIVHGIFWQHDPSNPINVYVRAQRDVFAQVVDMPDYMVSPPPDSQVEYVPRKTSIGRTFTQTASVALRYELGVSVSVSLEGVGFSTKLASLLVEGELSAERSMTIEITNLTRDKNPHIYHFYFEGGGVLHVWQTT